MERIALFFVIITLFSCDTLQNSRQKDKSHFEGIITYSIEYNSPSQKYSTEALKEVMGAKMVLTFDKGNYRKQYYSLSGKLLSERFLDLEEKRSYSKSFDNDTVYWFDISKADSQTTFKRIKDSLILGYSTIGIETKTIVSGVGFGDEIYKVMGEYHYAKNLTVNPKWYIDYKEGNFDEIIKIGKGVQLIYINKGSLWEQFITATYIEAKEINKRDITIQLNKGVPLKEL